MFVHELSLPNRLRKPREYGITMVNDVGSYGISFIEDLLQSVGDYIDIVKLGIGTAVVTTRLEEKVALFQKYGIRVYFGGTVFEAFLKQDKLSDYEKWMEKLGISTVEVSSGILNLTVEEKVKYIKRFAKNFTVVSEVGSKDVDNIMPPYLWVDAISKELDAGAWKVITEGRDEGTVGIYRSTQEIRMDLIEEIAYYIPVNKLIFEAPQHKQQIWFINKFGANVNLGNIRFDDVLVLETQRVGLRYDTFIL
ncbi:MAG: phosphosulfolactate synthase [Peptococcaceae bacterium]|nr:phosphosulfolactate synthase [Peptococcaceae bacterium]